MLGNAKTIKLALCVIGLVLYASTPWRDLWFYETVATNEGSGTTVTIAEFVGGSVSQLFATVIFSPMALLLIFYGIRKSQRIALLPKFDRFTWIWGGFSSLLFAAMLVVEGERLTYCLQYSHHWKTAVITVCYIGFGYVWWSSSIAHGSHNKRSNSDGPRSAG